jgi:cytochrome c oxidase cbb3-type subunit I/II
VTEHRRSVGADPCPGQDRLERGPESHGTRVRIPLRSWTPITAAALLLGSGLLGSGCGEAPAGAAGSEGSSETETAKVEYDGSVLYGRFCLSCHGEEGFGDGVSAKMLTVKPRDFTRGVFKFRSTLGQMPSDEDLFRTIAEGVGGTEMSPYEHLPPEAIWALVEHVKGLTVGEIELYDEEEAADYEGVEEVIEDDDTFYARINWFKFRGTGEPLVVPEPPTPTEELVARGKELFTGLATCNTCHGDEGLGDGASAPDLVDDWGFPISPRNFKEDIFKGGSQPEDIYRRVMLGIPGTPMPASKDVLEHPEDPWALVYYVLKLKGRLYIPK